MKGQYLKAVAVLLFLFTAPEIFGQKVVIQPVHDSTRALITHFKAYGFKNLETNRASVFVLKDTLEREEFMSYDSVYLMAEGYNGQWLRWVKIPEITTTITLKVAMKPLLVEVDEVVVSAARFAEKKKDVAQQINSINRKDIEFASQGTTADVLQDNGNVLVQRSQLGGGSPIIRGFEANKLLIVID